MRILAFAATTLVAIVVASGAVRAHNAQVAPEQYIRFLSDCSDDWGGHSAVRDGHDLVALDMTERWMETYAEPGFFVLLTVAFGFAETGSRGGPLFDELELAGPDGPVKVRLATADNSVFTAEEAAGYRVPDVILPVRPSVLSNGQPDGSRILIEFGFRFSTLGLDVGDKVTAAKVQAFAQEDRGDYMPGGYFLLGVQSGSNINDCPQSGHQGGGDPGTRYVRKDYTMRGTQTPYIDASFDTDAIAVSGGDEASIQVTIRNKFANQAQDVRVTTSAPAAWDATVPKDQPITIPALQTISVPVKVRAATGTAANGTLRLIIDTSVGGHGEREIPLYWYPKGVEATVPTTPTAGTSSSPTPAWILFGAASLSVAILARRR